MMVLKKMTKEEAQEFYNKAIAEADRLKANGQSSTMLKIILDELEFFYGCRRPTNSI